MKRVAEQHVAQDRAIASELAKAPQFQPCCKAGCSACCSEPVYCSEAEALHIIESLRPADLDEVRTKLQEWLFKTACLRDKEFPDANHWRLLDAPCPLLKNGLCSVYERRPLGCRAWFALKHPDLCQMPHRRHQLFAQFHPKVFIPAGPPVSVGGRTIYDHLGVLLAEKLLGLEIPSATRSDYNAGDVSTGWLQRLREISTVNI